MYVEWLGSNTSSLQPICSASQEQTSSLLKAISKDLAVTQQNNISTTIERRAFSKEKGVIKELRQVVPALALVLTWLGSVATP